MSEKVSAVVPTLNSGELLDRCVDALCAAAGVDEVIVVDGGSTDGSPERAAARERVEVVARPGTSPLRRANVGVGEARNELVLLLNSDAFVTGEAVERLSRAMAERPRLAVCGARLRYEDGSPQKSHGRAPTLWSAIRDAVSLPRGPWRRPAAPRPQEGRGVERTTYVPFACVLVRRSVLEQLGGIDERFVFYYDDYDCCRRVVEAGWDIAVCWDAEVVHIGGGSTAHENRAAWFPRYHQSRLTYLRKHYPRGWRLYAAVWAPRALADALAWWLRALARKLRSDTSGEQSARAWTKALLRSSIPGWGAPAE